MKSGDYVPDTIWLNFRNLYGCTQRKTLKLSENMDGEVAESLKTH